VVPAVVVVPPVVVPSVVVPSVVVSTGVVVVPDSPVLEVLVVSGAPVVGLVVGELSLVPVPAVVVSSTPVVEAAVGLVVESVTGPVLVPPVLPDVVAGSTGSPPQAGNARIEVLRRKEVRLRMHRR